MDFAISDDYRVKLKESKKKDKCQDLAKDLKKTMTHESDGDTNCNWRARYSHQRIGTRAGRLGNKTKSGDHPNYSIIAIGQNTWKSPVVIY